MVERDGRVGGAAPFSVSRADERACFPRDVTADASARNDATRLCCPLWPPFFELMPAITYASANGEEKTIQKAPCTH